MGTAGFQIRQQEPPLTMNLLQIVGKSSRERSARADFLKPEFGKHAHSDSLLFREASTLNPLEFQRYQARQENCFHFVRDGKRRWPFFTV